MKSVDVKVTLLSLPLSYFVPPSCILRANAFESYRVTVLKHSPQASLKDSSRCSIERISTGLRFAGGLLSFWFFGKVPDVHQFVVKLTAVTSLNRMWQGLEPFS